MNTRKINSGRDVHDRAEMVGMLDTVREHLAGYAVPAPVHLSVNSRPIDAHVTAQLDVNDALPGSASMLLRWAKTLQRNEFAAWRTPDGKDVHLSVTGVIGGSTIRLRAYASVHYDAAVFGDLCAGRFRVVDARELRTWAAMPMGGVAA